jgi:hypothetical protein
MVRDASEADNEEEEDDDDDEDGDDGAEVWASKARAKLSTKVG